MFRKILVVEDQQSIGKGLQAILQEKTNANVETSSYCDDAYLKLKAALKTNKAFDLLITDLSFQDDFLKGKIANGEKLIAKVKALQPNLKIVVFSIENNVGKIKRLVNDAGVDAFVAKGRREIDEIGRAMQAIYKDEKYYSKSIKTLLNNSENITEVTKNDILILNLLANGLKQNELPAYFKEHNIPSGSKRTIESKIERLKTILNAQTVPHLINISKNLGLI
ncbi:hypothetical protein PW52_01490 [Tamlana sedimentorum]|uniref:Response regulatory domain-containing protein n=1 Tax=Neotamlana sedimentorum TaxID=1435349 RepID=A0A0D7WF24_9FLAO|nr:response regulator [Tamlana sedimentorum]KJD37293.1 hypothetical protein PW52_01490 [Tamlana sedimentorum]